MYGAHADAPDWVLARDAALVDRALALFFAERPDSVVTVAPSHDKLGAITAGRFVPDYVPGTRSQDLAPRFREDGVVYVTRGELALATGDVFGEHMVALVDEPLFSAVDIDTALDLELAEWLFARHRSLFPHVGGAPTEEVAWSHPSA
jgi:CMP-N-acetylneuraminic acid synthetase